MASSLDARVVHLDTFYSAFLKPLHFLAFLSLRCFLASARCSFTSRHPLTAASTPLGAAIHHMAPIVGFVIAATIQGPGSSCSGRPTSRCTAARAGDRCTGGPRCHHRAREAVDGLPRAESGAQPEGPDRDRPRVDDDRRHPDDASVATDTHASLIIANRKHAYTYDESLADKRPGRGSMRWTSSWFERHTSPGSRPSKPPVNRRWTSQRSTSCTTCARGVTAPALGWAGRALRLQAVA